MHDILRETPIYQEFLKEGREEGLEQGRQRGRLEGREEGLEQGWQRGQLKALRQAIVEVMVERFPQFVRLTKEQVAFIEDPEVLRHVLVKVSVAQNAEEAKKHLLTVDDAKEPN